MIELEKITKLYNTNGSTAIGIHDVSLKLSNNEIVVIVGDSGAGKTTLMNVITGIDSYEEGEMLYDSIPTSDFSSEDFDLFRNNNVGFVFQNYNLIESYSVLNNVMAPLLARGESIKKAKEKAIEMIKKVGLSHRMHTVSSKLSGGEKQRTVIARALVVEAKILAYDEPTGNLDSKTSRDIISLIEKVSKDKLVLIVTHDFQAFESIATRKIVMKDGQIVDDVRLKAIETKEMKLDNLKERNMRISSLLYLSIKNLVQSIKRTFLASGVFLIQFLLILFLIFTGFGIEPTFSNLTPNESPYFLQDEKALYVYKESNQNLNLGEDVVVIEDNDSFYKSSIGINFLEGSNNFVTGKFYYFRPNIKSFDSEILAGSDIIQNDNELVISFNFESVKRINFKSLIDQEVKLYLNPIGEDCYFQNGIQYFEHIFKVVGVCYDPTLPNNTIILNDQGTKILKDEYILKVDKFTSFFYGYDLDNNLKTNNQGKKANFILAENNSFYFIETIKKFEIKENTIYIDSSIDKESFYLKYKNTSFDLSKYSIDNSNCLRNGDNYIYFLPKSMSEDFYQLKYQYRLYFSTKEKAEEALKQLETQGIYAERTIDIRENNQLNLNIDFLSRVFIASIFLVLVLLVNSISRVILNLIYGSKKNDYVIYKTIGFNQKKLRIIDITEIVILTTIIFLVAIGIFYYLLNYQNLFDTLKINNQYLLYLFSYFVVIFISIKFVFKFENKVFKQSIAQTLKAGDYLD